MMGHQVEQAALFYEFSLEIQFPADHRLRSIDRFVELFGRLKINRSIATRYDQLANRFLGMVHIATARYWLKFVHAA